jgi:hypothetical protein
MDDPERSEPELPAREAARVRRRERARTARDRELMRTGQAKAFKQILDAQAKRAAEIEERRSWNKDGSRGDADERSDPASPSR